jgi:hypothetical protein
VLRYVRNAWLVLGITLLFSALIEGACYLAFLVVDHAAASGAPPADRLASADDYRTLPWADDYFKEFRESVHDPPSSPRSWQAGAFVPTSSTSVRWGGSAPRA